MVRRSFGANAGGSARTAAGESAGKACQELPGQELIQYLDEEGNCRNVTSTDVNDYLREITGKDITAKDFRT